MMLLKNDAIKGKLIKLSLTNVLIVGPNQPSTSASRYPMVYYNHIVYQALPQRKSAEEVERENFQKSQLQSITKGIHCASI